MKEVVLAAMLAYLGWFGITLMDLSATLARMDQRLINVEETVANSSENIEELIVEGVPIITASNHN